MWAHYGALAQGPAVWSGRDPGNVCWNFAWSILVAEFPPDSNLQNFTSLKNSGNMIEGLLGYAWWRIHRKGLKGVDVDNRCWQELPAKMTISSSDVAAFRAIWETGFALESWHQWLGELAIACEALMQSYPALFPSEKADWARVGEGEQYVRGFEALRLNESVLRYPYVGQQ